MVKQWREVRRRLVLIPLAWLLVASTVRADITHVVFSWFRPDAPDRRLPDGHALGREHRHGVRTVAYLD